MLNINEMYKVCSDFCGGLSLEMVLICVGVMVVYSFLFACWFLSLVVWRCLCAIFILFCVL